MCRSCALSRVSLCVVATRAAATGGAVLLRGAPISSPTNLRRASPLCGARPRCSVAQLVERLTVNQNVAGSSPAGAAKHQQKQPDDRVPERPGNGLQHRLRGFDSRSDLQSSRDQSKTTVCRCGAAAISGRTTQETLTGRRPGEPYLGVAQSVARWFWKPEVASSSLAAQTNPHPRDHGHRGARTTR